MLHLPHRCVSISAASYLMLSTVFFFWFIYWLQELSSLISCFFFLLFFIVHDPLPSGVKCTKEKACPRCFQLGHTVFFLSFLLYYFSLFDYIHHLIASLLSSSSLPSFFLSFFLPPSLPLLNISPIQLKDCTNKLPEDKRCFICGEKGHESAECKTSLDELSKCPLCDQVHGPKECKANISIYPCYRCRSYDHKTADCSEEVKKFCSFCGKDDHFSSACTNKPEPIKRVIHCAICHSTEHLAKDCPLDKIDDEVLEAPKHEEEEKPVEAQKKQNKKLVITEDEFPALSN